MENIYEDFYEDKKFYDFSDYSRDSRFSGNEKVIDKMKDEWGIIISEFVGLKSKMYLLVDVGAGENKKAKGVNRSIVRCIRHK